MKYLIHFSRLLVGSLFIVSGLIKANDTLGFSYKLTEYFEPAVLNMEFLIPFSWHIAFGICIVEVLLGFAVIFGQKMKQVSLVLLGMIAFFTWLTFYSAYFNKVTDCGCFGDALKLTPWESFTKDVVLLFFVLILFVFKNKIEPSKGKEAIVLSVLSLLAILGFSVGVIGWWFPVVFSVLTMLVVLLLQKFKPAETSGSIVVSGVLTLLFTAHTFYYLPLRDFRPYATGKSISEGMKSAEELGLDAPVYATLYSLKNKNTGELKEVGSDVYMNEKMWGEWDFVEAIGDSYKVKDGYEPPIHDFAIQNSMDEEISEQLLNAEEPILFVISYDINKAKKGPQAKINELYKEAIMEGWRVIGLTASINEEVMHFKQETDSYVEYYTSDGIVLKTIIRSNPGLMLVKKGVVKGKYPNTALPKFEELKAAL
ncbi:MAG: putative membrane protein YphA (DoxX/SURF4 family) [Luteibaculaceae bacterium]|jgi:uncharacterized membrane protein YphA (DoxX/SURF4 family)